jgi:hypothetical protein
MNRRPQRLNFAWTAAFAVLLLATWVAQAPAEPQSPPDPRYSSIGPAIVGTSDGAPIPECAGARTPAAQGFLVQARNLNDVPWINRPVTIDFSLTGVRLYAQQDAGCTIDCAAHTLTMLTDLQGNALFHPRFGGFANGALAEVSGRGVVLGDVPVRSTDMDAQGGGTGLGDLALFAPLYNSAATNHPEADFDASGGPIGLGDFAIFAREYALGAQGTYCP